MGWVRLFSVTDYHGIGPKLRAPATVGRRFIRRRVGNRGARAAGDKPPPYSASTQRGFSVREKSRTRIFSRVEQTMQFLYQTTWALMPI